MSRILLVEPGYKNKYPPMGLMKISRYHKMLGDDVTFVKGIDDLTKSIVWDRIYVTSLFTFDFEITVKTINYYKMLADDLQHFFVGGIMASLMPDKVMAATGLQEFNILRGLFTDTSVVGDHNNINIDTLALDYDILEQISYKYPAGDNYFAYTSRGCPNHCDFCAVPILEPQYTVTNNIVEQIRTVDMEFGPKRNLLMLDNNILNAPNLEEIVDSLCEAGFGRGAKYNPPGDYRIVMMRYHQGKRAKFLDDRIKNYLNNFKKRIKSQSDLERFLQILIDSESVEDYAQYMLDHEADLCPIVEKYRNKSNVHRYIDFNQGVDGRKINDQTMYQLSRLAIKPLRIAFDHIELTDIYKNAVRTAYRYGIREISNYILFNSHDTPEDFYRRLEINIKLNRELGIQIFSFPMKYAPINRTDRLHVGEHWCKKYLSAISAILHVTKGVVAAGSEFFYTAFGSNLEEYMEILAMPRNMIIFRNHYKNSGETQKWLDLYRSFSQCDQNELMNIVSRPLSEIKSMALPEKFKDIIPYYFLEAPKKSKKTDEEAQLNLFDASDGEDIHV